MVAHNKLEGNYSAVMTVVLVPGHISYHIFLHIFYPKESLPTPPPPPNDNIISCGHYTVVPLLDQLVQYCNIIKLAEAFE